MTSLQQSSQTSSTVLGGNGVAATGGAGHGVGQSYAQYQSVGSKQPAINVNSQGASVGGASGPPAPLVPLLDFSKLK